MLIYGLYQKNEKVGRPSTNCWFCQGPCLVGVVLVHTPSDKAAAFGGPLCEERLPKTKRAIASFWPGPQTKLCALTDFA